jgi:predicted nuclease with TOPRIM domain
MLLFAGIAGGLQQEKEEAQKQIRKLQEQLEAKQQEVESVKKESTDLLEKQHLLHEEKLSQMTGRESELERRLRALIDSLTSKYNSLRLL